MDTSSLEGSFWDSALAEICSLDSCYLRKKKAQDCPCCGGKDRFEYLGVNLYTNRYDGSYLCRGCGAGDGFSLLMKLTGFDFVTAKKKIMAYLGIEQKSTYIDFKSLTKEEIKNNLCFDSVDLHPYLQKKKLSLIDLGVEDIGLYKNRLAIPAYDFNEELKTYELISDDFTKLSLKGLSRINCHYSVGNKAKKRIYLCEGVATALSLRKLTNELCIASFGCTNMINVFDCLIKNTSFSDGFRLVIACDNDTPGINVARKLYTICKCNNLKHVSCIIPAKENYDFSDLYIENSNSNMNDLLSSIKILFKF